MNIIPTIFVPDCSKGSVKDPATYRGLQVGSSFCKIIIILIHDRIRYSYNSQLLDNQQDSGWVVVLLMVSSLPSAYQIEWKNLSTLYSWI